MSKILKRSLDQQRGLNSELLRDHIDNTTIYKKNKTKAMIVKYCCLVGVVICTMYLMSCVYLDWSSLI